MCSESSNPRNLDQDDDSSRAEFRVDGAMEAMVTQGGLKDRSSEPVPVRITLIMSGLFDFPTEHQHLRQSTRY